MIKNVHITENKLFLVESKYYWTSFYTDDKISYKLFDSVLEELDCSFRFVNNIIHNEIINTYIKEI